MKAGIEKKMLFLIETSLYWSIRL